MDSLIKVGTKAADFELNDHLDGKISLSGLAGKKVLLSFHPLAFTGICTDQMKDLDASYEEFEKKGVVPLGLSVDPSPSKAAWAEAMGIKRLLLLSDFWPHGAVAESLGVFRPKNGFSERANILLDEKGVVIWAKIYEIKTLPDIKEVLSIMT